jgi:hypothetical protein
MNTKLEAGRAITTHLRFFIGRQQLSVLGDACYGEERQFFIDKIVEMGNLVEKMPRSYETENAFEPIAYLHYFKGNMDWYITEKDMENPQHQAFGLADLGYGGELGYISIQELIENNIELDLYFTPKSIKEIRNGKEG